MVLVIECVDRDDRQRRYGELFWELIVCVAGVYEVAIVMMMMRVRKKERKKERKASVLIVGGGRGYTCAYLSLLAAGVRLLVVKEI